MKDHLIILGKLLEREKSVIREHMKMMMQNNYENQSHYSKEKVDEELEIYGEDEAMVG